jgi:thiol-disulfide isomerase/thioredoxin
MVKTRKFKRGKPIKMRKTARRHRASTAGKILPPLDVRSTKHLKEFEKRIKKGPLTIVMVYADWCGHCHTMAPHFDAASKSPQRSIQSIKVNEQMLDSVNDYMSKNVPQNSKPISVEGYPSILIVDNKGNKVTDVEPVRNTKTMTEVMNKSANIASNSGLLNEDPVNPPNNSNIYQNKNFESNNGTKNANKNKLKLLGLNNTSALATSSPLKMSNNSSKNYNSGEEELEGKLNSANELNRENANKKNALNGANNKKNNVRAVPVRAVAPVAPVAPVAAPLDSNEEISLTAPIEPSSNEELSVAPVAPIVEPPTNERDLTISNDLTPNQKLAGGNYLMNKKGGNLMSVLSRTTYTLAPAAALIATASYVMNKNKTKKAKKVLKKKSRKHRK